jgi:uncharacterized membrane protein
MKLMLMLHLLGTVIWVGGMFFAHQVLRPVAAEQLEPPLRLTLWVGVFKRFFPWAWMSIVAILGSGFAMIRLLGGMGVQRLHVHGMMGQGLDMTAIFDFVFSGLFGGLKASVARQDWKSGAVSLGHIRRLVGTNLLLGLAIIAIATAGAILA